MIVDAATESLLRRDRLITLGGLAAITALAWLYLRGLAADPASMGGGMPGMEAMTEPRPWMAADFGFMFGMWAVMMVAMMTPSAAPMILLYARVKHKQEGEGQTFPPTGVFFAGYLAVWSAFSLGLTVFQWALEQAALLSPEMMRVGPVVGGLTLIAAGLYQWLPIKNVCLSHCRSPIHFLASHWRPGLRGAFRMGLAHGAYCLGCCWALMLLLFVGGVMNLLWVAAIAIFVLIEKATPFGLLIGRAGSVLLIVAGIAVLVS